MKRRATPQYFEYRDSLVIFADLLGFSRQVEQITDTESFQRVADVLTLLHSQTQLWEELDGILDEFRAMTISDSVVITMPWQSEVAATALIAAIHGFQYGLLLNMKQLLRGYMSRGRVYVGQGLLFGDGFTRAYRGEQSLKGPPRIVLDPDLVQCALSRGAASPPLGESSAFDYLRMDDDGHWFIDYLKPVGLHAQYSPEQVRANREAIRRAIREGIEAWESEENTLEKYRWLGKYEADDSTHPHSGRIRESD